MKDLILWFGTFILLVTITMSFVLSLGIIDKLVLNELHQGYTEQQE
jgi:hypothetical protein